MGNKDKNSPEGFGLSEPGGEHTKKRFNGPAAQKIKRLGYAVALAVLTYPIGLGSGYATHDTIQETMNVYQGVPSEKGPGDTIDFVFDESECTFRKYIVTEQGRTELADDNLPVDDRGIVQKLYDRGHEKDFFADAAKKAEGDYSKDFVLDMTEQGLSQYPHDIAMKDLPVSVTLPAAWDSILNEGSKRLKNLPCMDEILQDD